MALSMLNSRRRSKTVMVKVLAMLNVTIIRTMAYMNTPPRRSTSMPWRISGKTSSQLRTLKPSGS